MKTFSTEPGLIQVTHFYDRVASETFISPFAFVVNHSSTITIAMK